MKNIKWQLRTFDDFSTKEFHDLIKLRIEVFVVEQNCPYQELDGLDINAWHVTGMLDGQLVACARILAPGVSYDQASIGRVISKIEFRGHKVGQELMKKTMNFMEALFPKQPIKISAQQHLVAFYNLFGFEVTGKGYLEDDIPHIAMICEK